jgi:hypothetical protein
VGTRLSPLFQDGEWYIAEALRRVGILLEELPEADRVSAGSVG